MQERVCSATKLAAGNSFMSPVLKLSDCYVKKLEITLTMLSTADIVSIIIRNWLVCRMTVVISFYARMDVKRTQMKKSYTNSAEYFLSVNIRILK